MGFLDKIIEVTKTLADDRSNNQGAQGHAAQEKSMLEGVVDMFKSDGINGVVNRFKENGLGDTVSSWIGSGVNKTISSDQIRNVLGTEKIQNIAGRAGVSEEKVSNFLKDIFPDVVDRSTPDGRIEPDEGVPDGKQD